MTIPRWFTGLVGLLVALLAASCGGGGGGGIGGTGSDPGTLSVSITDAPACGYDAVYVTVERVRVHRSSTADDADAGWSEVVVSPARRIDLLSLRNGVTELLGTTPLPSGRYTQLRLVLAENGNRAPFANAVVPTGGAETALDTPSAQQSGLKLNTAFDVLPGQVTDVVLDFDACKSVVRRGNSGRYNLKPVIQVIVRTADAGLRVSGYIDPAAAAGGTASASLQLDGVTVRATTPEADGRFVFAPMPAGTYDLVLSAPGRTTAVVTGVPVVSGTPTVASAAAAPIALPVSAVRAVTGTVSPATASVRALQPLSGGPVVEAAWAAVDADSGAFAFQLPIAAPRRAAFVAGAPAPVFAADAPAAGRYTLEAALGDARRSLAIDATTVVPAVTFTFP